MIISIFQKVDIRGRNFDPNVPVRPNGLIDKLRKDQEAIRPIKEKKAADLKKLLPYIPRVHRSFYERIICNSTASGKTEDTD